MESNFTHLFEMNNSHYIIDGNTLCTFCISSELYTFISLLDSNSYIDAKKSIFDRYGNFAINIINDFKYLKNNGYIHNNYEFNITNYKASIYKLSLDVNHSCNLGCKYCYSNRNSDTIKMSFEIAKRAINYLIFDFGKDAKSYEINIVGGGEPLLNFDLIKQIKTYVCELEAKINKRIVFWIFTNGTVFNDDIIDWFILESQQITISIDGSKKLHDLLRPYPNGTGSFDTIQLGIKKIKERAKGKGGIENIWVSTVITSQHKNLVEILQEFEKLGIVNAQIRPMRSPNHQYSLSLSNLNILKNAYKELIEFLLETVTNGDLRYLKIIITQRDYLGRFIIRLMFREGIAFRCDAAKSQLCVLANGDIYPCDISCGTKDLQIGSIDNKIFIDSDKQELFYNQHVCLRIPCKACWARFLCGGGCYYSSYLASGDITKPDPVLCAIVKYLIELSCYFLTTLKNNNIDMYNTVYRYVELRENIIEKRDKIK